MNVSSKLRHLRKTKTSPSRLRSTYSLLFIYQIQSITHQYQAALMVDGLQQRISLASTAVTSVVEIKGLDHDTSDAHCFDQFRLFVDHIRIIE